MEHLHAVHYPNYPKSIDKHRIVECGTRKKTNPSLIGSI